MGIEIRAKVSRGMIKPLEKLSLEDGKEITVTIKESPLEDRFEKAMGGWRETIDCEQLIKDIYESRRLSVRRPEVKL